MHGGQSRLSAVLVPIGDFGFVAQSKISFFVSSGGRRFAPLPFHCRTLAAPSPPSGRQSRSGVFAPARQSAPACADTGSLRPAYTRRHRAVMLNLFQHPCRLSSGSPLFFSGKRKVRPPCRQAAPAYTVPVPSDPPIHAASARHAELVSASQHKTEPCYGGDSGASPG